MLRAMLLSRPKPPQAGPKASLYKGIVRSDNCPPRSVGRPLPLPQPLAVGPNRPPRRAKFTHSKFKRAKTVGYLLHELRARVGIDDTFESVLSKFLAMRNTVVHNIDEIPGWSLDSEDGIAELQLHTVSLASYSG